MVTFTHGPEGEPRGHKRCRRGTSGWSQLWPPLVKAAAVLLRGRVAGGCPHHDANLPETFLLSPPPKTQNIFNEFETLSSISPTIETCCSPPHCEQQELEVQGEQIITIAARTCRMDRDVAPLLSWGWVWDLACCSHVPMVFSEKLAPRKPPGHDRQPSPIPQSQEGGNHGQR